MGRSADGRLGVCPPVPGHNPGTEVATTQGCPEGYGRRGVAVSSGLSLAFMVIGLLAVVFALVVVWRRTPNGTRTPLAQTADRSQLDSASTEAEHIRTRAETEAAGILERARQEAEQAAQGRREVEEEIRAVKDEVRELRGDLERRETRLADREQRLDEELKRIEDRAQALSQRKQDLERRAAELDKLDADRSKELERVAALTSDAAKLELVATIENQAKREAALIVRDIEHEARSEGEKRARKIVTLAIQRVASEQTSESVVSVLHLPGDEMKGRIIGREGRNIRAFESVTGVNLIIDDTPEAVLLSCFDPVRREVARLTLEKLVLDGRIHPHRIEEVFEIAGREVDRLCQRAAEDALVEVGISDMHPELVTLLGRLRYRTSYGQNVLKHLTETAHVAGIMAAELRLEPTLPANMASRTRSCTQSRHTTTRCYRRPSRPSSRRRRTRARAGVPARAGRAWKRTSSAWNASRRSPAAKAVSRRCSRCRPAARSE